MRTFGPAHSADQRGEILALIKELIAGAPHLVHVPARDYLLEPPGAVIIDEATYETPDGEIRVALSRPEFRPPFEWIGEVTSYINESEYFKHYLVRDDDVVLAQRRDLTVIDDTEARMLLSELELARKSLR
jgi:hypothetical protein